LTVETITSPFLQKYLLRKKDKDSLIKRQYVNMSLVGMDSSDSESKALPRLLTLIKFLMPLTNTQMNIKISISKESPNSLKSKFFALHGTCPKALLKLLKTQE